MSKRQINYEAIEGVLQYIEAHPEELNMGSWFFGTTCCLAGTAARLAGYRPDFAGYCSNGALSAHVEKLGLKLLGLPDDVGSYIFHVNRWPLGVRRRFNFAKRPATRARILRGVVERLVAELQRQEAVDGKAA